MSTGELMEVATQEHRILMQNMQETTQGRIDYSGTLILRDATGDYSGARITQEHP
jgi:hypothetical protein